MPVRTVVAWAPGSVVQCKADAHRVWALCHGDRHDRAAVAGHRGMVVRPASQPDQRGQGVQKRAIRVLLILGGTIPMHQVLTRGQRLIQCSSPIPPTNCVARLPQRRWQHALRSGWREARCRSMGHTRSALLRLIYIGCTPCAASRHRLVGCVVTQTPHASVWPSQPGGSTFSPSNASAPAVARRDRVRWRG
jgi:hypothetical protein